MADYNDSINLGGAVWKPVPADKNEPFARTSRGSWAWPKTPVKELDWGKKLDVGAGNAAPLGGADGANLDPIGAANPSRRGNSGNTNPVIGQTNGAPLGGTNGVNRNPIGVAVPQFENRAPRHVRNIFPGPAPDFSIRRAPQPRPLGELASAWTGYAARLSAQTTGGTITGTRSI